MQLLWTTHAHGTYPCGPPRMERATGRTGGRRTAGQLQDESVALQIPHAPPSLRCLAGSSGKAGRQPWDVGRFAKTLSFFNKPPSFQQLLQSVLIDTPTKLIRKALGVSVQEAPLVLSVPAAAASSALPAEAVVPVGIEGVIMVAGESSWERQPRRCLLALHSRRAGSFHCLLAVTHHGCVPAFLRSCFLLPF
jgi:hypothetical protein